MFVLGDMNFGHGSEKFNLFFSDSHRSSLKVRDVDVLDLVEIEKVELGRGSVCVVAEQPIVNAHKHANKHKHVHTHISTHTHKHTNTHTHVYTRT